MTKQPPADAIIVLGGGVDAHGKLDAQTHQRILEAVRAYRAGLAPRLVMSGRCGFLSPLSFSRPVALDMRTLARRLGVPSAAILTETHSLDTISNLYFTKRLFLEPRRWMRVVIVTSDYHVLRSRFIARKVLGPRYTIRMLAAASPFPQATQRGLLHREQLLYRVTRAFLSDAVDGDDAEIGYLLTAKHPAFTHRDSVLNRAWIRILRRAVA